MKNWVWSDVHNELQELIYPMREQALDRDEMLIAGDRHRSLEGDGQAIKAIEILSLDWPHRFYYLDEEEVIIDNTRCVGASLWVDCRMNLPHDPPCRSKCSKPVK